MRCDTVSEETHLLWKGGSQRMDRKHIYDQINDEMIFLSGRVYKHTDNQQFITIFDAHQFWTRIHSLDNLE